MFTQLIAASLIPSLLLTQVNYDYPDNSHLPVDLSSYTHGYPNPRYLGVSTQIIPWSKFKGVKNNQKTIHPNRQVWQYLYIACRANQDGSRNYFYTAIDTEKHQELVIPVVQSGRQFGRPSC